ncbi:FAD-binding protein [Acetobacter sacchari]|uniref:L-aspartate oxidase n=1 Tax=Acetobacter sacchari TaxID=2661687 RepID=A0ABS3LSW7_9PROT|nr:FAD-binding protein [Acetobacter sacchari]
MTDRVRTYDTDVLIIGGGLAGCWTAISARRAGVRAIVAEKGYCGTSGVAASAGPGHWFVPPEARLREEAIARRMAGAQGLGDARWMERIIDRTYRTLPDIGTHYHYTPDDSGAVRRHALRGPEYLRALREKALAAGAVLLDHSPALQLLGHRDGRVSGAQGVSRQGDGDEWLVRAGAVVLATGGCAFRSHLLGGSNNTGDGLLMAVEAGAALSGMEFSSFFTVAPANTPLSRAMIFSFARYYDTQGREIAKPAAPNDHSAIAVALQGGPVLCDLSATPEIVRRQLPQISPNVTLTFRRLGIDPFTQRFPISLLGEGTIRGVGGVRVTGEDAGTDVPGLYVAGDVASREPVTGPVTGGGAVNAAWALASGCIAAEAAARSALENPLDQRSILEPLGDAGLSTRRDRTNSSTTRSAFANTLSKGPTRPDASASSEVEIVLREEMLSPTRQYFRNADTLAAASARLSAAWGALRDATPPSAGPRERQRFRELAAMTATARWCTASAAARTESLGMHRRTDSSTNGSDVPAYVISGGADTVWTRRQAAGTVS